MREIVLDTETTGFEPSEGHRIVEIGAVINGSHPGRTSAEEITLFDGTGVGLQDLAVASAVVRLAAEKGVAQDVAF